MSERKRYVVVGTGGRSRMFIDAICDPEKFAEHAELVGFCDISQTRMDYYNRHIQETFAHAPVPTFPADQFDEMIRQTQPHEVIVTTMDGTHHEYIIRAMEHGCDAITEKPMTTDAVKAKAIFDAVEKTGRNLRVTFNYRYQPAFTKLREVVMSGAIGRPTLVDFQWRLDTSHGADYFRRWHREKKHSGGLLVHKATHHFDLVNFWLGDRPESVFAFGDLAFYGEQNATERGEHYPYERYTGHPEAANDPFALTLDQKHGPTELKALYRDAEADSGYIRDRNVFGGEDKWPITSEDTMAVTARYRNGTILSYSLIAYCPWEGERIAITGTEGQVEYFSRGKGHLIAGQSDEQLAADQSYSGEKYVRLQKMFEPPEELEIPEAQGGHGGGDIAVLRRIFEPNQPPDPYNRDATHVDGANSILLGIAANRAIETGQVVQVDDLLQVEQFA